MIIYTYIQNVKEKGKNVVTADDFLAVDNFAIIIKFKVTIAYN